MKSTLTRSRAVRLGSVLTCVLAPSPLVPLAAANSVTGTRDFQLVSRLTGPSQTGHVGVGGTDLGHMVNHNGKTYFLFGDTFASEASEGSGGPDWRNNVMAWSTDTNPANGITFDGWLTRSNGTARQAITPGSQPTTYIPTGAISANGNIYAWYMHVSDWSTGWTLSHAGLARWREGQSQFTTVPGFRFDAPGGGAYTTANGTQGPGNFGMVAASRRAPAENVSDPHIYIWGTPGGREGGVKLARVLPEQIENKAAYQYFDGTVAGAPQWVGNEFDANKVVPSGVGEMSVMYNEYLGAWTMMSTSGGANPDAQIRQADNPWGPWSEPKTVARFAQAPGLYAPYMNPAYVEGGGRTLYFTMSLWNPYDVYLAKVTLDVDPQARWKGSTGDWDAAGNWTPGTPTAERRTLLDNGGVVTLDTAASARLFDAGTAAGQGGTVRIVDGGALTIHDGGFRLGLANGGRGELAMTGGSVNVVGGFNMFLVGDNGDATASVQGGSITVRTFGVALQPTSTGHLELGGEAVITTTGDRFVLAMIRDANTGRRPVASMNMTGGTVNVNAGASGVPDAVIGFDGAATLNLSGGRINVAGLFVSAVAGPSGNAPSSEATIDHSGGAIHASRMALAENGRSNYALSGTGRIDVGGRLTLGWREPSQSTFTQAGGTVNADTAGAAPNGVGLIIADRGKADYTITAGTLSVPRQLSLGDGAGSVGHLRVSGGTVHVGGAATIGNDGTGSLTASGGALTFGELRVADADTSTGLIRIVGSDATISVADRLLVSVGDSGGTGDGGLGTLRFEPDAAGDISLIDVTSPAGTAILGNDTTIELDASLAFAGQPAYDLLTASDIVVDLNAITFNGPAGYELRISPGLRGEVLQAVPEPASMGMLAFAGVFVLGRRRRTR